MRSGKSRFCVIGRDGECNGEDELTTGSGHTSRSGDTLEEEEAQRSDTDDMNDDFEREYTFDEVTGTFVRRAKDVKGGDVLSSPPSAKRKRSSSMGDYSSPAASPVSASASSTLEEMDVILDAKIQITYRLFHNFVVGTAETYYPYLFAQEKEESTRAPSNQDVEAEVQKSTQTDGRDLTGTGNQIGVEPGRDRFKSTAPSPSLCSSPVALAAHTDAKSPNPSHTSSPSATLETELPYFYPKSIRIMWIPGQDPVGTVDPVDVGATDITNCGDAYLGHVLRVMKRRGWVDQLVILWAEDK